ncbi:COG3650 family protein [Halomonas sp. LBP4]|uniref:COG3650 family protein n=1 Tax=Halomonas sp. LBP4 TaxID=2044917 RepID=UPI000D7644AD|nr:MliC family protein [Halomonas sp. LBP4]PXY00427.1 C-type lysozyme, inhibitor [Halomonas sp. LBP4]
MSRPSAVLARPVPLLLGAALVLAGCAAAPGGEGRPEVADRSAGDGGKVVQPTAPLMPSAFFAGGAEAFVAWRCTPAQDLVTAHPDDELRLWSAHGAWRLSPAVVASGARYQQDDLSFWNKGEAAVVESPSGRLDCSRDLARTSLTRHDRPGVMFHARGNEPGWVASLPSDVAEIDLLLDYGSRQLTLPYRVTTLDNGEGRMILASGRADTPFELRIEGQACFDDMSGEPFPARVTLTIDGETYRGCGQGIAP